MKAYTFKAEDGSLLIEIIGEDVRIGIALEPNLSESSWHYVTKKGICDFGIFGEDAMRDIIDYIAKQSQPGHHDVEEFYQDNVAALGA